jgi:hypothetical protein
MVQRGWVVLAEVPSRISEARLQWDLEAAGPSLDASASDGLQQGRVLHRLGFLEVEVRLGRVPGRWLYGPPIVSGRTELHRPILARPGPTGPDVLPLLCPINECLSTVEVGSSHMAMRLVFLVPNMPRTSLIRSSASVAKRLMMVTSRSWWAHAGGWCS